MRPASSLAVIVPVLRRPHRVAPLLASLARSMADELETEWEPVFVCSPGDGSQIAAVLRAGLEPLMADVNRGGDYARKINLAALATTAEWLFTGADDLHFHPGWLSAAFSEHERTSALVIGTNDLCNPTVMRGAAATHSLVHRSWLDRAVADSPGHLLCERYDHNCVDVELVETARAAGVFAFATDSHVEHLHWTRQRSRRDATYRKGIRNAALDRKLLAARRHLWAASPAAA